LRRQSRGPSIDATPERPKISADGREIVITGVTVHESHPSGKPALRRFIDWHFVLAQLGSLPGRPLTSDNIIRV
jgi:hypothetical protein